MRVALIGRHQTLLQCAKMLASEGHEIVSILTATGAPEYEVGVSDFFDYAQDLGVPFHHSNSSESNHVFLSKVRADIGVSVNFPTLIPKKTINLFEHGILNAHGGDLPRYRGNACQAWAILNGEEKVALCIHKMEELLDSGDILARKFFDLNLSTSVGDVLDWMMELTPKMMTDTVSLLEKDPSFVLERQSTIPGDSLRCYPRQPSDGRILWSNSSLEVLRLVKASGKPFDGAFTFLENEKIVVWDAELAGDEEGFLAVAGQVLVPGPKPIIACGQGAIRITNMGLNPRTKVNSVRQRLN